MSSKDTKCLLVQWANGEREIVNIKHVIDNLNESLRIGCQINVKQDNSEVIKPGTLVAISGDYQALDQNVTSMKDNARILTNEALGDYSPSGSSWKPSDVDDTTTEESEIENKMIKIEPCKRQYINRRNSKKVMTPVNKLNPLIPNTKKIQTMGGIKRKRIEEHLNESNIKDSITVDININDVIKIKQIFGNLFSIINREKGQIIEVEPMGEQIVHKIEGFAANEEMYDNIEHEETIDYMNDKSISEGSDRSADNVLITNKYDNIQNKSVPENTINDNEWVPIGSGITMIHREDYAKVNWKTYTTATRTLLLAVFPRRILATHSLTGKKSPAFHNKPAKMCLDPKAVLDIIIEITSKYNVKARQVRSIITTKCADETKMYKKKKELKDKAVHRNSMDGSSASSGHSHSP